MEILHSTFISMLTTELGFYVIFFVIFFIATSALAKFCEKKFANIRYIDSEVINKTIKPIYWMLFIIFFIIIISVTIKSFELKTEVFTQIKNSIPLAKSLTIIFCITLSAFRFVKNLQSKYISLKKQNGINIDIQKIDMFSKLAQIVILICTIISGMQVFGVGFGALATVGGLGGLIIGFSTKDLFSNFFGLFSIYLDRPFAIGDEITILEKGINGIVEEIGLRTTTIRTNNNKTAVMLPNSIFNTTIIENNSRMLNKIFSQNLKVDCNKIEDLTKIFDKIIIDLKNFTFISNSINSRIKIIDLDNRGSTLNFQIFFEPMNGEEFAKNSNNVIKFLLEEFKKNKINIVDKNEKIIITSEDKKQ